MDPGAVPGASTILWGRNRIDTCNKDKCFARHGTTVIGLKTISANFNRTSQRRRAVNSNRLIANRNRSRVAVAARLAA